MRCSVRIAFVTLWAFLATFSLAEAQEINISPSSAPAGTMVTVSGDLGEGGEAWLFLNGVFVTETVVEPDGFSLRIRIPHALPAGRYTVRICQVPCERADSPTASTTFEVTPPAVGNFDVEVLAIEVNQGVRGSIPTRVPGGPQILNEGDIVHVANRRTLVRVYPTVRGAPGARIPPMRAQLHAVRATESLPGSPLDAMNLVIPTPGESLADMRADMSKSWNFLIPLSWVQLAAEDDSFSMVLAPEVNTGGEPECAGCEENNSALMAVEFEHVRRVPFRVPLVHTEVDPGLTIQPYLVTHRCRNAAGLQEAEARMDDFLESLSLMRALMPLPEGAGGIVVLPAIEEVWDSGTCDNAGSNADIDNFHNTMIPRYFPGGVREGDPAGLFRIFFVGGTEMFNGGVAWCNTSHVVTSASPLTMAHEVAHALAIDHAGSGHCEDVHGCSPAYPEPHGQVERETYGFDFREQDLYAPGPFAFPPSDVRPDDSCQHIGTSEERTHDYMSGAAGSKWSSEFMWNLTRQRLQISDLVVTPVDGGGAQNEADGGSWYSLNGTINEAGELDLDPLFFSCPPGRRVSTQPGRYAVEFLDVQGALLWTRPLPASTAFDGENRSRVVSSTIFAPDGWRYLRVLEGATVLKQIESTTVQRQVTLESPGDGETWPGSGRVSVAWSASGEGVEALEYRVEISDDSQDWVAIESGLTELETTIRISSIPAGGGEYWIRVQASDGTHVIASEPRRITLAARAPRSYLVGIKNGAVIDPDDVIRLSGFAGDWQDGFVDDESLVWRLDGVTVASGREYELSGLTPGEHRIVLRSTNSAGVRGNMIVDFRVRGSGGAQRPGDLNQDGGIDISDSIGLFGYLFLGSLERLPCEGDANVALLDFNGDGNVDISDGIASLSWLFAGGVPHELGLDCVEIDGCNPACL